MYRRDEYPLPRRAQVTLRPPQDLLQRLDENRQGRSGGQGLRARQFPQRVPHPRLGRFFGGRTLGPQVQVPVQQPPRPRRETGPARFCRGRGQVVGQPLNETLEPSGGLRVGLHRPRLVLQNLRLGFGAFQDPLLVLREPLQPLAPLLPPADYSGPLGDGVPLAGAEVLPFPNPRRPHRATRQPRCHVVPG